MLCIYQGECGAQNNDGPQGEDGAIKAFKKKFSDKTRNKWDNRAQFTPVAGKYTLIEMGDDDGDEEYLEEKVSREIDVIIYKCTRSMCLDEGYLSYPNTVTSLMGFAYKEQKMIKMNQAVSS